MKKRAVRMMVVVRDECLLAECSSQEYTVFYVFNSVDKLMHGVLDIKSASSNSQGEHLRKQLS